MHKTLGMVLHRRWTVDQIYAALNHSELSVKDCLPEDRAASAVNILHAVISNAAAARWAREAIAHALGESVEVVWERRMSESKLAELKEHGSPMTLKQVRTWILLSGVQSKDIALRAGLSRTVVSNVLMKGVRNAKIEKVVAAIIGKSREYVFGKNMRELKAIARKRKH